MTATVTFLTPSDIEGLARRVTTLETSYAVAQKAATALTARVTTLEKTVTGLGLKVATIQATMTAMDARITKLEGGAVVVPPGEPHGVAFSEDFQKPPFD